MGIEEYSKAAAEVGAAFQTENEREMRLCLKTISKLTRRHIDQELEASPNLKNTSGSVVDKKRLPSTMPGEADADCGGGDPEDPSHLDVSDALKNLTMGSGSGGSSFLKVPGNSLFFL